MKKFWRVTIQEIQESDNGFEYVNSSDTISFPPFFDSRESDEMITYEITGSKDDISSALRRLKDVMVSIKKVDKQK